MRKLLLVSVATLVSALALIGFVGIATQGSLQGPLIVAKTPDASVSVHVIFPNVDVPPFYMHYVEHLTWLNTAGMGRAADRHSNAWTTDIAVGYWLSGPPEDLPDLLRTLAGIFDPIDLPREFAGQERAIILREYEYRMAHNPDARAAVAMNAFLYSGNAIAASALGTPEDIMALDYDEARTLHDVTHVPQKARLVVVGPVSRRQVRRAMRAARWPTPDADRPGIGPSPFDLAAPDMSVLRYPDPDTAPRLIWRRVVTLPEPVQFDLLGARASLLRDILNSNLPGGLAGPLRFNATIARSFGVRVVQIDEDNIEIIFAAAPDRGVSLSGLQAAFEATLAKIAAAGVPEDSYARVLKRYDRGWPDWDDDEDTAGWMADYVLDRVSDRLEPLSERALKGLDRGLSLQTTNALLRQLAGEGRTAIALIGPEDTFE